MHPENASHSQPIAPEVIGTQFLQRASTLYMTLLVASQVCNRPSEKGSWETSGQTPQRSFVQCCPEHSLFGTCPVPETPGHPAYEQQIYCMCTPGCLYIGSHLQASTRAEGRVSPL